MVKICIEDWVDYYTKASLNANMQCKQNTEYVAYVQIQVAAFDRDCDLLLFRDLQTNECNKKVKAIPAVIVG